MQIERFFHVLFPPSVALERLLHTKARLDFVVEKLQALRQKEISVSSVKQWKFLRMDSSEGYSQ